MSCNAPPEGLAMLPVSTAAVRGKTLTQDPAQKSCQGKLAEPNAAVLRLQMEDLEV